MHARADSEVRASPAQCLEHERASAKLFQAPKGHAQLQPVVAGVVKGEKVEILATGTHGKDTSAYLGSEKWSAVVYDGEAMIDVDD